jgi:hypothetical protein
VELGRQDLDDAICTRRSPLADLDAKSLVILDEHPFKSDHLIAGTLHVARSTVLLHLHDSIGFRSFHLHWMLHLWTHDLYKK